jgi:two-component system cell cycle sensor histidine kinase/response regulator CckA
MRTAVPLPSVEPLELRAMQMPAAASAGDAEGRQAHKMETLGRLACGLAHDFNNVLTVISGYSQLLLSRGGPRHEMRDELLQIQLASERAATFIRQLLCFSGTKDCQAQRVDLNGLVADQVRLLRPLIGDAIEVSTVLAEGLAGVEMSPAQLLQLLLNLAANARDAMPRGGHLILTTGAAPSACRLGEPVAGRRSYDVSTTLGVAGNRAEESCALPAAGALPSAAEPEVWLRVTDTGCGMDEHVKARVFEPFFTTKASGQGTGLGLAIVADLVKSMRGRVEVESEPGQGSSFTMYFPAAPPPQPAPVSTADAAGALKGSETILVVEDADYVRMLLERVLTMNGYTVLAASNGHQAIQLAERVTRPIDLLITDVVMPRMSGRQVVEALAAIQVRVRVLFVSGYTAHALDDPVARDESESFLQKPFTPDALLRKVREILGSPGPPA